MFRLIRRLINPISPASSLTPMTSPKPAASKSNPPGSPNDLQDLKAVLNVLRAYILTFGRPDTELELRAVIGAIAANLETVTVANQALEPFIDRAVAAFRSLGMEATLVDVTAQLLAEQVAVWLQAQENTVKHVLSAYLQRFAPAHITWGSKELTGLVQTVIAALNDGSLSKSGARALVVKVIQTFNLDQSLRRWVAPEWIALAQRVASYLEQQEVQLEVRSIAWAYIKQFQAILSPQLIEQILETGPLNLSPAEVLSLDLGDFSRMLYFKFQLLEADPVVTKSHQAIAADVHRAVAQLKARREPGLDVTEGKASGALEISSPFFRPRR